MSIFYENLWARKTFLYCRIFYIKYPFWFGSAIYVFQKMYSINMCFVIFTVFSDFHFDFRLKKNFKLKLPIEFQLPFQTFALVKQIKYLKLFPQLDGKYLKHILIFSRNLLTYWWNIKTSILLNCLQLQICGPIGETNSKVIDLGI